MSKLTLIKSRTTFQTGPFTTHQTKELFFILFYQAESFCDQFFPGTEKKKKTVLTALDYWGKWYLYIVLPRLVLHQSDDISTGQLPT